MERSYLGDGKVSKQELNRAQEILDNNSTRSTDVDYWRASAIACKIAEDKARSGHNPFSPPSRDQEERAIRSVKTGRDWTDYYNQCKKSIANAEESAPTNGRPWQTVLKEYAPRYERLAESERNQQETEQRRREYEREQESRRRDMNRLRPPSYGEDYRYDNHRYGCNYRDSRCSDYRDDGYRHNRRRDERPLRDLNRDVRDLDRFIRDGDRLLDSIRGFGK